jgi:hypothetical protein
MMKNSAAQVQPVQDGITGPGRGPFTITDKYGATAITAVGDGIAVSPNINKSQPTDKELLTKIDKLIEITSAHKNIAQQGRIQVWNDQVVAKENIRTNMMNNTLYFS